MCVCVTTRWPQCVMCVRVFFKDHSGSVSGPILIVYPLSSGLIRRTLHGTKLGATIGVDHSGCKTKSLKWPTIMGPWRGP